ncbi:hypothetical protein V6N11_083659 [Hibiscus sabdariffa]|uniref:Uncharacterized protein n=1 Tax=Hibiscus sabdariffa TaxID=183260 RepID=A0ABR2QC55_9ROSI
MLIAWEDMQAPTNQGGLGFRDIEMHNFAFLRKLEYQLVLTRLNCGCVYSRQNTSGKALFHPTLTTVVAQDYGQGLAMYGIRSDKA